MNHSINFGAICSDTGIYTLPSEAIKNGIYICIECKDCVFVKQGEIRKHHFCHYPTSNCTYYTHTSESEIHKNAKMRIKSIFEQKCEVSFIRKCVTCNSSEHFDIPSLDDTSRMELEYRFIINPYRHDMLECIADIVYINNEEPLCMIEVYHSHNTSNTRRVEPWFEVNATDVLQTNIVGNMFQVTCIRKESCDECIAQKYIKKFEALCLSSIKYMNDNDLEFYIRYHLGQRDYNRSYVYHNKDTHNNLNPTNKITSGYYISNKFNHKRFVFDKGDDVNDSIIALFSEKMNKNPIVRTDNGECVVLFTLHDDKKKYNFREISGMINTKKYSGMTTTNIIMDILRITNKYETPVMRQVKNSDDDTDADTYRLMRYRKQHASMCIITDTQNTFDINSVKYDISNRIFTINHPLSNKRIRYTSSGKVYHNGKWIDGIYKKDIIMWYKAATNVSAGFEHMWSLK